MSIVRRHRPVADNYTVISNDWVRDENLSYGAIGLLTQLMSHREGWQVSIRSLAGKHKAGRDAIRTLVAELEAAGYLARIQTREDGTNRFGETMWETREPDPVTDEPLTAFPTSANPTTKKTINKETKVKDKNRVATRIPDDFEVTDAMRDWAAKETPSVDLELQTANFRDYWASKAKDATKLDWVAAWRTWMRNDEDRKSRLKPSGRVDREKANEALRRLYEAEEQDD